MTGGWEERGHPLREEWVIVAAHRQHRPWVGEVMARPARTVPARRGAAAEEAVARIAAQYAAETGRAIKLFSGSSPGAASFGVLRLAMD